jgi:hypothetical protein
MMPSLKRPTRMVQTFQESDPSYCFLRVFQGLSRAGARRIDLKLSRTEILLETAARFPTKRLLNHLGPARILPILGRPAAWTPALEPICVGLLSATVSITESFRWDWQGEALVYSHGEFKIEPSNIDEGILRFTVKKLNRSWLPNTKTEHADLGKRLSFSPVQVFLDAFCLSRKIEEPEKENWYQGMGAPFFLAVAEPRKTTSESSICIEDELCYHADRRLFAWTQKEQLEKDSLVQVDANLQGSGRLYPIIDGVLAEAIILPQAPGLRAYMQVSDLQTDLSGLALHEPDDLIAATLMIYKSLLQKIRPHLELVKPIWPDPLKATKKVAAIALLSFEGLLLTPVLLGMAAVEGGLKVGYRELNKTSKTKAFDSELLDRVERALKTVEGSLEP